MFKPFPGFLFQEHLWCSWKRKPGNCTDVKQASH